MHGSSSHGFATVLQVSIVVPVALSSCCCGAVMAQHVGSLHGYVEVAITKSCIMTRVLVLSLSQCFYTPRIQYQ